MTQQLRCFTVIGDSNVDRHFSLVNARACPLVSSSQLLTCGSFRAFPDIVSKIRPESNVCIVACLTNFLTCAEGASSVSLRVEPAMIKFRDVLLSSVGQDRAFLICPPMYRTTPLWYREGLPEIMQKFSDVLSGYDTLHLMPSFATPHFEDDGVHLTAYSGLEFVLHLFDSASLLLENLSITPEAKATAGTESTRRLEDRMMAIEQDHRRLNRSFEYKTAVDAELADYYENLRLEDSFVISGLARISGTDLSTKEWQARARRDVGNAIKKLLGKDLKIVFVANATGRGKDADVRYVVKMSSVDDSAAIRDKFGFFFTGGTDTRPPHFKGVSVRNALTKNTRIRIDILHLFGQTYKASNAGAQYKVIGYRPRPVLKLFPPPDAADRRVKSFTFIEAVRRLPFRFTSEDIEPILRKIDSESHGKIRSIFVVLSDDMLKKRFKNVPRGGASSNPANDQADVDGEDEESVDDPERVDDQESQAVDPVPPPPSVSRDSSRNGSRGNKRGPPSPPRTASKNRKK